MTGSDGSVTSSVAILMVASSSLIYAATPEVDGRLTLSCLSSPGSTNVVLSATNLMSPVYWQPIATNLAGADGRWQYIETNAASYTPRFFRSLSF